jgi:hypothetical protein
MAQQPIRTGRDQRCPGNDDNACRPSWPEAGKHLHTAELVHEEGGEIGKIDWAPAGEYPQPGKPGRMQYDERRIVAASKLDLGLMTRSNFISYSIDKSARSAPLRMRSNPSATPH